MFRRMKFVAKDVFNNTKIGLSVRERKLKKIREERLKEEALKKKN
jgi:regulator of PEP synthase PpsR (kinase-PPPase family)